MAKSKTKVQNVEATNEDNAPAVETKTKKSEPIKLTAEQQKAYDELKTTSARIRYLDAEGFSRGQIAKHTGKIYQHVRNVLITPLKRQD